MAASFSRHSRRTGKTPDIESCETLAARRKLKYRSADSMERRGKGPELFAMFIS